jgi:hypothetical protein
VAGMSDGTLWDSRKIANHGCWRWPTTEESCADGTVGEVETFPDSLPGSSTEMTCRRHLPNCRGKTLMCRAFQERHQGPRNQTQTPDFLSQPDTDGASATGLVIAITAIDSSSTNGCSSRALVVIAVKRAMLVEGSNDMTVRTGRELQPLRHRKPMGFIAIKPTHLQRRDHGGCGKSSGMRDIRCGEDNRGKRERGPARSDGFQDLKKRGHPLSKNHKIETARFPKSDDQKLGTVHFLFGTNPRKMR